jgi:2-methylcitrate dehydratase PrpD
MRDGNDALSQCIRRLAEFAVDVGQSPISPEVEHFGRLLLLDSLGALVGGTRYPAVRAMRDLFGGQRLAGSDLPFGPLFTLGSAATWLDADSGGSFHPEGHRLPPVPTAHPAPHVLPVILHGAANGIEDNRLVRAFILAIEIGMRFGTATSLRPGMHPHGIHGPVAAAVGASVLRGHSATLTAAATTQSMATPMAARLHVPMAGGTVRNAWTGLGAYYGAKAAVEAGNRQQLDAGTAARVLSTVVTTDMRLELLTDNLKSRWAILDSYLKPYACARWIHPILDATRSTLADRAHGPGVDAIHRIEVETFAFAASLAGSVCGPTCTRASPFRCASPP